MGEIIIDCSVPPSLNRLWRYGKGHVYKDPKYQDWIWEFLHAWRSSIYYYSPFPAISGTFDVEILVHPKRKRDADNSAKAILDACQGLGIVANDSLARRVVQELVSEERAPRGCRITITTSS